MKLNLIFLFIYSLSFGSSFSNKVSDFFTAEPLSFCKEFSTSSKKNQCRGIVVDQNYRPEMIQVCSSILNKMGDDAAIECLEITKNRDINLTSREHIENCESIIPSKKPSWVLACLKSEVSKTFAIFCSRYTSSSNKQYKNAASCAQLLDGSSTEQFDMAHFNAGCGSVLDIKDFNTAVSCIEHAEGKKTERMGTGTSTIRQRYNELSHQK